MKNRTVLCIQYILQSSSRIMHHILGSWALDRMFTQKEHSAFCPPSVHLDLCLKSGSCHFQCAVLWHIINTFTVAIQFWPRKLYNLTKSLHSVFTYLAIPKAFSHLYAVCVSFCMFLIWFHSHCPSSSWRLSKVQWPIILWIHSCCMYVCMYSNSNTGSTATENGELIT